VAIAVAALLAAGVWLRSSTAPAATMVASPSTSQPATSALGATQAAVIGPDAPSGAAAQPFFEASAKGAVAYAGGDALTAADQYRAAIARNPDDAESLSNLGQMLVRTGMAEEAIPYFDRAIALIPQRWAYHFNRARALGIIGQTAEAVAGYREAQKLFPNDYATAFNLGLALHKLGDEAAAVEAYRKAIELDQNDASFRLALGISLERLQQPAAAAAAYSDYLRLAPAAPDVEAVRGRITRLTQPSPTPTPGNPGI
jgi:tetratricopeptide (TPR) repeat protein